MEYLRETLPAMHRLALAYAPKSAREPTLALLALDTRLAAVLRGSSEPVLTQIRLSWWRDMLARDPGDLPSGEPLLAATACWGDDISALIALVDGWEHLVEPDKLGEDAMRAFCEGRGAAWAGLARLAGCPQAQDAARRAGEGWALMDLAARLSDPVEKEAAARLVDEAHWRRIALPRALRPLAILHGLAVDAAGRRQSASDAGSLMRAVRIGLFGR